VHGIPEFHNSTLLRMFHPSPIRVNNPHGQYPTISVHVLRIQSGPAIPIFVQPRPYARSMMARTGCECRLDAVGVDAGYHVECTRPQCLDHDIDAAIYPTTRYWIRYSAATPDVTSVEWMLASIECVPLCGPAAPSVGNGREEQASAGMTRTVRF